MDNDIATRIAADAIVDRYRAAVEADESVSINAFLPEASPGREACLHALLLFDLRRTSGKRANASAYFEQYPEVLDYHWASELIAAEVAGLDETNANDALAGYQSRFPAIMRRYRERFAAPRTEAFDLQDNSQEWTEGTKIGDYEIGPLLGRGAHSRVFLAREVALDRHVALKVSKAYGNEGLLLAKLNHPHIVRVYREQQIGTNKLLAMEYVVGQSLDRWLDVIPTIDRLSWKSAEFIHWAGDVDCPQGVTPQRGEPAMPKNQSFTGTMVWIVNKVACALHHAHQRGVLHLDVKPGNIMLDTLGQPRLTDFNVGSKLVDSRSPTVLGGTINYMSPEQLKAMEPWLPGAQVDVDVRADVYSLGLVLYRLLTGKSHWRELSSSTADRQLTQLLADRISSVPSFKAVGATPSLVSIVRKSLAPKPDDRYQTAGEMAEDLDCWLLEKPLRFALDPSWTERLAKYVRRNKRAVGLSVALVVLVIGLGLTRFLYEQRQLVHCTQLIDTAMVDLQTGHGSGAAERLGEARAIHANVVFARYLSPQHATVETRLNSVGERISQHELQRFVSRFGEASLTAIHGDDATDGQDLIQNALDTYGVLRQANWQKRSPYAELPEHEKREVAEQISELLIVSMRRTSAVRPVQQDEIDRVVRRMPTDHQNLALVKYLRQNELQRPQNVDSSTVSNRFEAYLHGVLCALDNDFSKAHDWFARSMLLRRSGQRVRFWTHYRDGHVCQQSGQLEDALTNYGVCIGLRPDFAWPRFNLALACLSDGNRTKARFHVEQAINIDQRFTSAYVTLGAIQFQDGEFEQALSTYDLAIELGLESSDLFQNRATVNTHLGNHQQAKEDLKRAKELKTSGR